ncbi:DUF2326 domain-containing protein [Pusillimonas sp.]|uniref:DUF2326 domain-containing protein n=1 Tax=Pusillimonas sp. TaxID=3040095 RepID=UPI00299FD6B3|nr:DUF2326 domain-containing protein [Pusillimonas sp.]MDX3894405.1 DUF2326 domain-containing protein [Pusillimonas sp.]
MKLSRLYSNKPDLFGPIEFRAGLNVVLAEIRLPENKDKDTHNLGKTTLGRMIDFCFLAGRDKNFFLFKQQDTFKEFVFFLEIELADATYVTVRRGVSEHTKISFKKHEAAHQDFTELADADWDHFNLSFDRAREMLDGLLDWRAVSPWDFRKGLGYQLRGQDDYQDVFQLRRFAIGKHKDWKPYVAHILGFDHQLIEEHYSKLEELEDKKATAQTVQTELGGSVDDMSKIEGILLLKQKDADKTQQLLDAFDFREQDKDQTETLVEGIDARIAELNARRYSLNQARRKIVASLEEDQILFAPDQAEKLFNEAGILFSGQIKKDFSQLIAFNRSITEERRGYLLEECAEIEAELKTVVEELDELGKHRSDVLGFLSSTDVFAKYKQVTDDLVTLRADIAMLEKQRGFLRRLQQLRAEIRALTEACVRLQEQIEADVESQNTDKVSLFSVIRVYFSEIVEAVLAHKALLSVSPNANGHLEFRAEILDDKGKATSADLGHTYRKLLCIAFDLAVLRGHLQDRFPHFVYHDGVFESLDDRKKVNLLKVIREYAELGVQSIITLIDSDMPPRSEADVPVFAPHEIVLTLHDEGDEGRLFRTKAW